MKALITTLLLAAPLSVLSQAASPELAKKPLSKSRAAAVKAVEGTVPLEDADPSIKLSDNQLAIAKQVYVGEFPCELGADVKIRVLKREGFFLVVNKTNRFVMHPVESRTGAIRLEDPARGAMLLQLGNKTMLMSQKMGQRLADECQSPEQANMAAILKAKPAPNLLDPQAPAAAAPAPAAAPTPGAPAAAPTN